MATQNKRKLAALNKENCEEHPGSDLAQNSNVPRSQEDYITQISEEIEGRVSKKLSQEFSRTKNRILGALARFADFLMNPLIQGHSGTAPETYRNAFSINQGTNEDDSQSNPHPEAGLFNNQMTQNSGPEDGHDKCLITFNISLTFFPPNIINLIETWREISKPQGKSRKVKLQTGSCCPARCSVEVINSDKKISNKFHYCDSNA